MFLHNDVLEYRDPPGHLVRILWIDVTQSVAYTFVLRRPSATPRSTPLHVLVADVSTRRARLRGASGPGAAWLGPKVQASSRAWTRLAACWRAMLAKLPQGVCATKLHCAAGCCSQRLA